MLMKNIKIKLSERKDKERNEDVKKWNNND